MTTDDRLRTAFHELGDRAARQAWPATAPTVPARSPGRFRAGGPDRFRTGTPVRRTWQVPLLAATSVLVVFLVLQTLGGLLDGEDRDRRDGRAPAAATSTAPTTATTPPPSVPTTSGPVVTRTVTTTVTPPSGSTPPATRRADTGTDSGALWVPVAGATSVYANDPVYRAAVGTTTYESGRLTVDIAAKGNADLAGPEPTCLVLDTPDGARVTLAPDRVVIHTSAPGDVTATVAYSFLQPGAVSLQYACRADYSTVVIGALGAPFPGAWMPTAGQVSASPGGTSTARVEASALTGRELTVWIGTSGTNLPDAAKTCIVVTSSRGRTTLRPARTVLRTDGAGNPTGALTYTRVPSGTVTLTYACDPGWTAARVGVLG